MSFILKLMGVLKMSQVGSIDDSYAHGVFAAGNFRITTNICTRSLGNLQLLINFLICI